MTGEITLRGRVLQIGGLREKILAAYRAGLKTIVIPEKNMKDLVDVPKKVRDDLKIIPVNHMDQVLDIALHPANEKKRERVSHSKTVSKETTQTSEEKKDD
jgi:ATP-dependent Lon protease